MSEPAAVKPPVWFWIVGVILLLWNLMGLVVFGLSMTVLSTQEALKEAGMNEAQIELLNATPTWVDIAFGVAVIFGVLGCIALFMRRKLVVALFAISLLGVVAQNVYVYFMSNSLELMGVGLSPAVILIAIAAVPFSMWCAKQDWFGQPVS